MTTYRISDHTATEYRAMAFEQRKREAESFERCDTDGFLSQWASAQMERTYLALADYVSMGTEGGDVQEIMWPMLLTHYGCDEWCPEGCDAAHAWSLADEYSHVEGQYGPRVRVWDATSRTVTWWSPSRARKAATARRNDERKGVRWALVRAHVEAYTYSAGLSCGTALRPTPDNATAVVEVVTDAYYPNS